MIILLNNILLFIAQGFFSGRSKIAPGTVASAVIMLAIFLLQPAQWLLIISALIGGMAGIYICARAEGILQRVDDKSIVWDEWIGVIVLMCFFPIDWVHCLAGFIAFRFFDISKIWPVSWVEKKYKGGFGIMLDDIVAALYAVISIVIIKEIALCLNF